MADGDKIESLSIEVTSSVGKANTSIRNLTNYIGKLDSALSGLNASKIQTFSSSVKKLSTAMQGLSTFSSNSALGNIARQLKQFERIDSSKLIAASTAISAISRSAGNIPQNIGDIGGLDRVLTTLRGFGSKNAIGANKNIEVIGKSIRKLVSELNGIPKIDFDISSLANLTKSISKLGGKGAGNAVDQIPALAQSIKKMLGVLATAPKVSYRTAMLVNSIASLGRQGRGINRTASTISSAFSRIGNSAAAAVPKINVFRGTLLGTLGGNLMYRALYGLKDATKSIFELGSAMVEVENVVDVSFGKMNVLAYEFAKTAKDTYGLSELAAKQYTGTLMAMFNSSGIIRETGAEMSIALAGLAGDLASFYNIDTELAFTKIRAGISGEIEPLRQLGINLSVANLEQYAMTQGITKSYQAMNQAEKTMLRYNYLMAVTGAQQGDFARTSGRMCAA